MGEPRSAFRVLLDLHDTVAFALWAGAPRLAVAEFKDGTKAVFPDGQPGTRLVRVGILRSLEGFVVGQPDNVTWFDRHARKEG